MLTRSSYAITALTTLGLRPMLPIQRVDSATITASLSCVDDGLANGAGTKLRRPALGPEPRRCGETSELQPSIDVCRARPTMKKPNGGVAQSCPPARVPLRHTGSKAVADLVGVKPTFRTALTPSRRSFCLQRNRLRDFRWQRQSVQATYILTASRPNVWQAGRVLYLRSAIVSLAQDRLHEGRSR